MSNSELVIEELSEVDSFVQPTSLATSVLSLSEINNKQSADLDANKHQSLELLNPTAYQPFSMNPNGNNLMSSERPMP